MRLIDTSKVVKELESDHSVKLYGSGNSDNYLIPVKRAIEIVKQGGVCETGRMINVDPVIQKLQKRIDDFLKLHPERKGCEEVVVVEEFIHTLEIEAHEQNKDK